MTWAGSIATSVAGNCHRAGFSYQKKIYYFILFYFILSFLEIIFFSFVSSSSPLFIYFVSIVMHWQVQWLCVGHLVGHFSLLSVKSKSVFAKRLNVAFGRYGPPYCTWQFNGAPLLPIYRRNPCHYVYKYNSTVPLGNTIHTNVFTGIE